MGPAVLWPCESFRRQLDPLAAVSERPTLEDSQPGQCLSAFCFRGGVVCLGFFMAAVPQAHLRKDLAHKGLGWTACTWLKSNFARNIPRRVSLHRSPRVA